MRDDAANELDDVARMDDLSLRTLIALVARLSATETYDHYLSREIELDMALFFAEENLKSMRGPRTPQDAVAELRVIREHVQNAHDFVGASNVHGAIEELNKVIEMKMGL
ncbi:MAG: hypothetical protein GEU75_16200 [Dehalococcoidia bacterium]|nr:hypothetical protein [Dehalococcoidia bacterium]